MTMKRRDALKTMGALAGAATMGKILPGCGGDGPGEIKTIVVMMMENRSYDHLFGARKLLEDLPGDGLTADMSNLDRLGVEVVVSEVGSDTAPCDLDPPHGWDASHAQFNGGANDGFLTEYQNDHDSDTITDAMQYLTRDHVPVSWALADEYTTCDAWFCSVMGPTWPNRMFWHTGQSNGIIANDLPAGGFNWQSIYHKLVEKEIEYGYYYGDVPVLSVIEDIPGNVDRLFRMEDFYRHAEAGELPPVVYIDPAFSANDDHPPHHPLLGQQLISSIYTALSTSPQWNEILFVVTYDENGGYFDHVAPPTVADDRAAEGFDQLGFRVPTMVIGPWVKQGVVSTQYDHTSVLKHIENMFGLDPLTARSSAANDLTDCLDLERMARNEPREPITMPSIDLDDSVVHAAECTGSISREDGILGLANAHPEIFGRIEDRPDVKEYLYMIGDYLEKHGVGRIRRG